MYVCMVCNESMYGMSVGYVFFVCVDGMCVLHVGYVWTYFCI